MPQMTADALVERMKGIPVRALPEMWNHPPEDHKGRQDIHR
jgi:hypothetical protein